MFSGLDFCVKLINYIPMCYTFWYKYNVSPIYFPAERGKWDSSITLPDSSASAELATTLEQICPWKRIQWAVMLTRKNPGQMTTPLDSQGQWSIDVQIIAIIIIALLCHIEWLSWISFHRKCVNNLLHNKWEWKEWAILN